MTTVSGEQTLHVSSGQIDVVYTLLAAAHDAEERS
jgi:hypothetical protein